jgi:archaellum component FlaF (FlaF/FlaG flagellin family)
MPEASNIIRSPYCVADRGFIAILIRDGFLHSSHRHSAEAVENAERAWRADIAAWKRSQVAEAKP